jgi:hypothetical protein
MIKSPKTTWHYRDAYDTTVSKRFRIFHFDNYRIARNTTMVLIAEMKNQKLNSGWEDDVVKLYNTHGICAAVKLCRQCTEFTLKESIKIIENIMKERHKKTAMIFNQIDGGISYHLFDSDHTDLHETYINDGNNDSNVNALSILIYGKGLADMGGLQKNNDEHWKLILLNEVSVECWVNALRAGANYIECGFLT